MAATVISHNALKERKVPAGVVYVERIAKWFTVSVN